MANNIRVLSSNVVAKTLIKRKKKSNKTILLLVVYHRTRIGKFDYIR